MLRTFVALLLLANLGFLAWTRGWLEPGFPAPRHGEHEPQRIAAQVNPGAVLVLPPRAASAAVVAARAAAAVACVEAGPLAEIELAAAEAALTAAALPAGSWTRETLPPPPPWLVYAGRWPDAAERRRREAELRKLGLEVEVINTPADLAPGLVLSRHDNRVAAEEALAKLTGATPPLRGARVVQAQAGLAPLWLRVARADADLQVRLQALPAAVLAGGFKPCGPAAAATAASGAARP